MDRQSAEAERLVDDARVRVTRFTFPPGAQTGWHRHGLDYVIVAVTDCPMALEEPDGGRREVDVPAGSAYAREAGVEHNVINRGAAPMVFLEIELK